MTRARDKASAVVANFASTGIDDNADANAITIDSSENVAFTANANFGDNDKAQFGAGSDLQIYHDGNRSWINDSGTGDLRLITNGAELALLSGTTSSNEYMIQATKDGAVTMYYDAAAKIATTSSGVDVTGTVTSDGLSVDSGTTVESGSVTNQTSSSYATNDGGIDNILTLNSAGSSDTQSCGIQFSLTKSGQTGAISEIGAIRESSGNSGLVFRTRDSGTGRNERMRINSSGNLLIGRTNTNNNSGGHYITKDYAFFEDNGAPLFLNRFSSDGSIVIFRRQDSNVGDISVTSSGTAYNTSSDYRLKTEVNYDWDATTRLKQLRPARFKWIVDGDDAVPVDGFLAHEAQAVVPESVTGTKDEVEVWKDGEELPDGVSAGDNKLDDDGNTIPLMQGIDQSKLVPLLVKTILELEARITALEAE